MSQNPASVYLQSEAATIPRLKLVRMVYAGTIESLQIALAKLDAKDRPAFVKSVQKAQNLLAELQVSLDHERGGEISRGLERLYEWMQRTLTPACLQGDRAGVSNTIEVLTKLKEGWDGIRDAELEEASAPSM
jgi:flagellar protein FliS